MLILSHLKYSDPYLLSHEYSNDLSDPEKYTFA